MCTTGFLSKEFPSAFEGPLQSVVVVVSWSPHHQASVLGSLAEGMLHCWVSYFALGNYVCLVVVLHGDALHHVDKWLGNENMDSIFFFF